MSSVYSPIMNVGSGVWMLGRIVEHVAQPLTGGEIEEICAKLNAKPDGAAMIAAERARQVTAEGWTPEHDAQHTDGALRVNAAILALKGTNCHVEDNRPNPGNWGLAQKHADPIKCLTIAGALIAAEIDRLQRKGGAS